MKNVAVVMNGSFFLKNVTVTNELEGYPSRLVILGTLKWLLHINTIGFYRVLEDSTGL